MWPGTHILKLRCRDDTKPDGVSPAREQLGLDSLEEKRKKQPPCLLTKILQNENKYKALAAAHDEITQDKQHHDYKSNHQRRN